jgi:hypothetical protein
MADYYPLISRAVAGLEKNSGDNRRALYERARAALLAQLRGVTPALNESDITRERLALEESIRKVEAESARKFVEPTRQPPAPKIRPIEQRPPEEPPPARSRVADIRQWQDEDPQAPPPRRYVNPPPPEGRQDAAARRPRPAAPPPRQSDPIFDQPSPSEPPAQPASPPAQPRHPLRRPAAERHSISDSGLKDFRSVVSEANELGEAPARAERSARDAYAAVPSPATDLDRAPRGYERSYERAEPRMFDQEAPQERMFEPHDEEQRHETFSEPMLEPSFALDDARPVPPPKARRAPPQPREDEEEYEQPAEELRPPRSYGNLIKGLIVAAVAVVVVGGLIGVLYWQWPNLVGRYRAFTRPAPTDVARDVPAPGTSKKVQERLEQSAQESQASVVAPPGTQPAATVAQKVVLYEEDPADPNGKRFVGSAIWRTETVNPGPGQPPELAIRADVEVPERKLAMTWSLRRNTDKGLPASHTVEIIFKLPADFPAGGITNVPGIMMKPAETVKGAILRGLAVKVTSGYFLIGLSNSDADKDYNIQMLKERAWFDIPVVYNNSRRAILAVEKGTPGERAFAEAFKAWKQ